MSDVEKMDSVFDEARATETVPITQLCSLLGTVIRKTAGEVGQDEAEIKAPMQRAFLVAETVRSWLEKNEEGEEVPVPVALLEAVRKDAEGPDAEQISVSDAMATIAKRLAPKEETSAEAEKSEETQVEKSDQVVWDVDLADEKVKPHNWGPDPDWSAA